MFKITLLRYLYILALLCYFLPFMPSACSRNDYDELVHTPGFCKTENDSVSLDNSYNSIETSDTVLNSISVESNNNKSIFNKIFAKITVPNNKDYSYIGFIFFSIFFIVIHTGIVMITILYFLGLYYLSEKRKSKRYLLIRVNRLLLLFWLLIVLFWFSDLRFGAWIGIGISVLIFILSESSKEVFRMSSKEEKT